MHEFLKYLAFLEREISGRIRLPGNTLRDFGKAHPRVSGKQRGKSTEASTWMCIQSFTKYLLSNYCAQLTAPGTECPVLSKIESMLMH